MVERLKEMWQDARQMRDERGLTLVELLVVVVILGIIAAISVIAVGNLIENSRKDAQVANAKQLASAAKLYIAQNPLDNGEEADMGTRIANGDIADTAATTGTSATNRKISLSKFVEELKDPMNDDAQYKNAFVTVKNTSGEYTYKVTLEGADVVYFNADNVNNIKKSDVAATAVVN